jgi:RNA polymerase sigma-70 factor (ECF subfamily)
MSGESEIEARIQEEHARGEHSKAATLVISAYGGEILAFLISRLRSASDADEVFATFAEKLWLGIDGFEWRCTIKAWAYCLARNAANDYASAAHKRPGRNVALSQHPGLLAVVENVRSTTEAYRRTEIKDKVRALRERLSPDDQMLLILRVDRHMDFRDLAVALSAPQDAALDGAQLDREAARLRKRFERVKDRLRELAREEGLIE